MRRSIKLALIASAFVGVIGCQGREVVDQAPRVPDHCEGIMIPLEEVQDLMQSCKVESVGQPHNGPVMLHLADGTKRCFVQPRLDWVVGFASAACAETPIRLYIE